MTRSITLVAADSPCVIKNHLITQRQTLILGPCVELRFDPGVMLAVNGTLLVRVSFIFSRYFIYFT
jgi:hypothetical protein